MQIGIPELTTIDMKTPHDYYTDYEKRFFTFSDQQLIEAFNMEVGNMTGGCARSQYLAALHNEFHRRELDYSAIGDINSINIDHKVELLGNVIKMVC